MKEVAAHSAEDKTARELVKELIAAGDQLDAVACDARCYNLNRLSHMEAEIASANWRAALNKVTP